MRLTELMETLMRKGIELESDDPDPFVVLWVPGDRTLGRPPVKVYVHAVTRDLQGRVVVWGEGDADS